MSTTVKDFFDSIGGFEDLFLAAAEKAETDWEVEFTNDMMERYETSGADMSISDDQMDALVRMRFRG